MNAAPAAVAVPPAAPSAAPVACAKAPSDPLQSLPLEVFVECLGYLALTAIPEFARVSRAWRRLTTEPAFWQTIAHVLPGPAPYGALASTAAVRSDAKASQADAKSVGTKSTNKLDARLCLSAQNPLVPAQHEQWRKLFDECDDLAVGSSHTYDLLERGVYASSTDHPSQGISNLLDASESFWSSTGSAEAERSEYLLFAFVQPLCIVTEIQLLIYECHYQRDLPIYGPQRIRFFVGFHETTAFPGADTSASASASSGSGSRSSASSVRPHFHYVSGEYDVGNHTQRQSFRIAPYLVTGAYLGVELIGRRTKQPSDDLYYTVLQHIRVLGTPVSVLARTRPVLANACVAFALDQHPALFRALLEQPTASPAAPKASAAGSASAADSKAPAQAHIGTKQARDATATASATASAQPQPKKLKAEGLLDDDEPGGGDDVVGVPSHALHAASASATASEVASVLVVLEKSGMGMAENFEKTRSLLAKIRAVLHAATRGRRAAELMSTAPPVMIQCADMVLGNLLNNQNARSEVVAWIEALANAGDAATPAPAPAPAAHKQAAAKLTALYLMMFLRAGARLNHAESMAVGRVELVLPALQLLSGAMDMRLLFCTVELGDALYSGGAKAAALSVYALGHVPDKVLFCLAETGGIAAVLRYCRVTDYAPDWYALLTRLRTDAGLPTALRLALALLDPDTAPAAPPVVVNSQASPAAQAAAQAVAARHAMLDPDRIVAAALGRDPRAAATTAASASAAGLSETDHLTLIRTELARAEGTRPSPSVGSGPGPSPSA